MPQKRWLKQILRKRTCFSLFLEILWHKKTRIHSILFWLLLYFCLYLFAKTEYFSKTPKPHRVEFSCKLNPIRSLVTYFIFFYSGGCLILPVYGAIPVWRPGYLCCGCPKITPGCTMVGRNNKVKIIWLYRYMQFFCTAFIKKQRYLVLVSPFK